MHTMIKNTVLLNFERSIDAKKRFMSDNEALSQFSMAVDMIISKYMGGGRLYVAGNGGSAADAQHLVAEFISKLSRTRGPLPAEALTVDSSVITSIANDYGYEYVFSRQLEAKAFKKDIFLGLTTSGSSKNIIQSLKTCKNLEINSVVFTGHDGGECKQLADFCIIVPSLSTVEIQEVHIVLCHTLCELVESHLFPTIS